MRKFALLALASAVTLAWGTAQAYTPGIYKASAPGMGGPVEVTVEFSKDAITSITVSPNKETPGIGSTNNFLMRLLRIRALEWTAFPGQLVRAAPSKLPLQTA